MSAEDKKTAEELGMKDDEEINEVAGENYKAAVKVPLDDLMKAIKDHSQGFKGKILVSSPDVKDRLVVFGDGIDMSVIELGQIQTAVSEDDVLDGRNHNLHVDEEEDSSEGQSQEEEKQEVGLD